MARIHVSKNIYSIFRQRIAFWWSLSYLLILAWIYYLVFIKSFNLLFSWDGIIALLIGFGPLGYITYYLFQKTDLEFYKFLQGSKGEDIIENELKKLGEEYVIFRNIQDDRIGNVDFVVVGPTGVFAIEVKSHRGIIEFNGEKLTRHWWPLIGDFLKQARGEAGIIQEHISKQLNWVVPVVVFSNPYVDISRVDLKRVNGVYVRRKDFLIDFLKTNSDQKPLSVAEVQEIEDVLIPLVKK